MRKILLMLAMFVGSGSAFAGAGTGVGVVVGSPNGFTVRHWMDEGNSFEGSAGWSISGSRFQVNANYLYTISDAFKIQEASFDVFFGGGLSFRTKSGRQNGEVVFGPRLPVGVSYEFTDPNIEVFVQGALNVGVIPSSDVYADANLGVRFYF